jgi:hypothetical protein
VLALVFELLLPLAEGYRHGLRHSPSHAPLRKSGGSSGVARHAAQRTTHNATFSLAADLERRSFAGLLPRQFECEPGFCRSPWRQLHPKPHLISMCLCEATNLRQICALILSVARTGKSVLQQDAACLERKLAEKITATTQQLRPAARMVALALSRTCVSVVEDAAQKARRPAEKIVAMILRRRCVALTRRPPARQGTFASRMTFVARHNSRRGAGPNGVIIQRRVSAALMRKTLVDGRVRPVLSAAIYLEAAMTLRLRSAAREAPVLRDRHAALKSVVLTLPPVVKTDSAQQQSRVP